MKDKSLFKASQILFMIDSIIILFFASVGFFIKEEAQFYKILFFSISFVFFIGFIVEILSFFLLLKIKLESKKIYRFAFYFLTIQYFRYLKILKFFKFKEKEVQNFFIKINNQVCLQSKFKFEKEDVIILLPHCIQKSSCRIKITSNINWCKKCGNCDIEKILNLKEKYKISIYVATGGTLARKIIKEKKPKAIIAVACERDLISGILDCKGSNIIGVYNQRPNGPCFDTRVDIEKIEKAICFFLNKK